MSHKGSQEGVCLKISQYSGDMLSKLSLTWKLSLPGQPPVTTIGTSGFPNWDPIKMHLSTMEWNSSSLTGIGLYRRTNPLSRVATRSLLTALLCVYFDNWFLDDTKVITLKTQPIQWMNACRNKPFISVLSWSFKVIVSTAYPDSFSSDGCHSNFGNAVSITWYLKKKQLPYLR